MLKKILLVDDEGIITRTVGNLLKREGYNVEISESGQEAIEKVKTAEFDLIVTDIKMSKIDGVKAAVSIKNYLKEKKKPDIPIIFITGYADSDAYLKAEKYGKVVFKPFDMKEFLTEVAKSLTKK